MPSLGPIGRLLQDQQQPAAARFSDVHDRGDFPQGQVSYRALIPLTRPALGEQYAFEVDLDACSGCKACVAACHNLNGLGEHEMWRSVGLLHGGTSKLPVLQHVTTACHHCVEPACLDGCPVGAYVKEPETGIVRHLDDQCFGCQYCILKCPYDVPKYLPELGIVRKCDMCHSRLAVGEAPACVEACPNAAIRITLVDRAEVAENAEANLFVPGAAGPDYTLPTTQYKTRRPLPANLLPADYYSAQRQHAHAPLVAMLILTQMSVGAFFVDWIVARQWNSTAGPSPIVERASVAATLMLALIGALASVMHLGRPWLAYRAVLGWRTSWLSREVIAFAIFGALAFVEATLLWNSSNAQATPTLPNLTAIGVIASGLSAIGCSTMVYASTRRAFWNAGYTGAKFLLTTILLGSAATLAIRLAAAVGLSTAGKATQIADETLWLCRAMLIAAGAKLFLESLIFGWLRARTRSPLRRTAMLMCGDLAGVTTWRFVLGAAGGLVLPSVVLSRAGDVSQSDWTVSVAAGALVMLALNLVAESLERYLFFAAVVAPKMPGGPAA